MSQTTVRKPPISQVARHALAAAPNPNEVTPRQLTELTKARWRALGLDPREVGFDAVRSALDGTASRVGRPLTREKILKIADIGPGGRMLPMLLSYQKNGEPAARPALPTVSERKGTAAQPGGSTSRGSGSLQRIDLGGDEEPPPRRDAVPVPVGGIQPSVFLAAVALVKEAGGVAQARVTLDMVEKARE
jgi:hypothetical protein